MTEKETNSAADLDALVMRFMPLARSLARRYAGNGAEFDDLSQEGWIILHDLVGRWLRGKPDQPLSHYLWHRVRGAVRDTAERLRRRARHDSIEQLAEDVNFDVPYHDGRYAEFDLLAGLNIDERCLALDLAAGLTQKQIAQTSDVSQQMISRRVGKLREKLRRQYMN